MKFQPLDSLEQPSYQYNKRQLITLLQIQAEICFENTNSIFQFFSYSLKGFSFIFKYFCLVESVFKWYNNDM